MRMRLVGKPYQISLLHHLFEVRLAKAKGAEEGAAIQVAFYLAVKTTVTGEDHWIKGYGPLCEKEAKALLKQMRSVKP